MIFCLYFKYNVLRTWTVSNELNWSFLSHNKKPQRKTSLAYLSTIDYKKKKKKHFTDDAADCAPGLNAVFVVRSQAVFLTAPHVVRVACDTACVRSGPTEEAEHCDQRRVEETPWMWRNIQSSVYFLCLRIIWIFFLFKIMYVPDQDVLFWKSILWWSMQCYWSAILAASSVFMLI